MNYNEDLKSGCEKKLSIIFRKAMFDPTSILFEEKGVIFFNFKWIYSYNQTILSKILPIVVHLQKSEIISELQWRDSLPQWDRTETEGWDPKLAVKSLFSMDSSKSFLRDFPPSLNLLYLR